MTLTSVILTLPLSAAAAFQWAPVKRKPADAAAVVFRNWRRSRFGTELVYRIYFLRRLRLWRVVRGGRDRRSRGVVPGVRDLCGGRRGRRHRFRCRWQGMVEPRGHCGNVSELSPETRLNRYNRRVTKLTTVILLTTCFTAAAQKLPTVAVLSTGGTIASKQDPAKGGYLPALSGEDLISAVPAIKKIAQIQVEQISNISSSDITPEIWVRLAGRVNELLAKPEISGIVVTHGTNTLGETAYFLAGC